MEKSNIKKIDDAWIEKYRPSKLDDVVGQDEVIKRLKQYVVDKRISQHLMFAGPPGTGKTTIAMAIAEELFGEGWRSDFLELNTSDERGIDVVRKKVKGFASTDSLNGLGYKIIFLDEADGLTNDAQAALRRLMERYSNICKFILACNYSSKMIEPISSRCAVYRFKGINQTEMQKRLLYVCEKESLKITQDAIESIIFISEGDLRRAINSLQSASLLGKEITIDKIYKSSGIPKGEDIEKLIKYALTGEYIKSFDMLDILMIDFGFSSQDIIKSMFRITLKLNVGDKIKVNIIDEIGETDFRINEGSNEKIQMRALIAYITKIGSD